MSILSHLTLWIIGFTVFSAAALLVAYWFFMPDLRKSRCSKLSCAALLVCLMGLQCFHYMYFSLSFDSLVDPFYLALLLLTPPLFCFFSRHVLFPDTRVPIWQLLQIAPVLLVLVLPESSIPPIAFAIGTGYTVWFAVIVYRVRNQHNRFKFEMFFFGLFALMAVVALALGLLMPYIDHQIFYVIYSWAIGSAMFCVLVAIMVFPEMVSDIQRVADMAYAKSKLGGIDIHAKQIQLEALMLQEEIYQDEKLNLSMIADMLALSVHQLSELINTQYGYGFSRFVRQKRVEKAKLLLVDEPTISVLSISLMTGFQSQSNFYSAFKEVTGESPGHYRKSALKNAS
jgi:AraC-like DNA-binding protein